MPLFRYNAYDSHGNETNGITDADDAVAARQKLKLSGLIPFTLEPISQSETAGTSYGSLSLSEQSRFARQLAALLKGGVPLTRAISGMESQDAWKSRKSTLIRLREGIEKGGQMSAVLLESGGFFAPELLSIVKVGESTGRLDFAFARISEHLDRSMEHRRRFISAIAYPAITALISIGVVSFLMVYLVPVISKMFTDVRGELPWITRLLISTSEFFSLNWLKIAVFFLFAGFLLKIALKNANIRRLFERFQMKVPIWGKFIEGMNMEAWSRSTGMMIQCGVTLLETVRILKTSQSSLLLFEALSSVEKSLERGMPFSEALKSSQEFPIFLIQMIEAGEASGELAPMLESAAAELESENRVITELFLNILEPFLIVFMGSIVGAIMIGVLLPIYEMNRFM